MFCSQSGRGKRTRDLRYQKQTRSSIRDYIIPCKTVLAIRGFTDPYIRVVHTKRVRAAGSQYGWPQVIMCMAAASTLSPRTTLIDKVPIL
jgi:hypothetical protein